MLRVEEKWEVADDSFIWVARGKVSGKESDVRSCGMGECSLRECEVRMKVLELFFDVGPGLGDNFGFISCF